MRITNEVYLVGGGPSKAFGLSADPDCHIYLIDGGSELALVDCGMGTSLDQIVTNIERDGLDRSRLRTLILTHYHMDHAGGAARFREHFDLQVLAPRAAAVALRGGDERAVALDVAKAAGFYAADYVFEPVAIDRELSEGDQVQIGDLSLTVFATPGHCHGHASYLLQGRERRYLFAADAVFAGGRVVLQNIHDCSIQESAASILKLATLEFEALLPGHGAIAVNEGQSHVRRAAAAVNQLFVPKNLA